MAEYTYRAIGKDGKIVSDTITAANVAEARSTLGIRNLRPIEINEVKPKLDLTSISFSKPKWLPAGKQSYLKTEVLSHFCRQLSVILDSGINTIKGLEVLKVQIADKKTKEEIDRLQNSIERGLTVSEAMEEPGSLFPPILAGMVKAGESTGKIDIVLKSMAEYYKKENLLQKKTKSAAVYPMIVLMMAVGLVLFFINFLLPVVVNVIEGSGGELFILTRILIGLSDILSNYFYLVIPALIAMIFGAKRAFATEKGSRLLDSAIFRLPMVGQVRKNIISLRFAMAMYVFTISGFSILQGLGLLKSIVGSPLAEDNINSTIQGLQRGESISENLKREQFFDDILIQMVSIGEETGQMQKLTEKLVDYYDKEVELGITRLISLSEPVLMLVIGVVVGVLIISVALPMMTIFTNV